MKRLLVLLLAVLMLFGIFTGCSKKEENINSPATSAAEEQTQTSDNSGSQDSQAKEISNVFPLTVTDATGFEMTIAKKPQSIISLTLGTDEMLLSLVEKDRIKALSAKADDPGLSNVAEEAASIQDKLSTKDVEKIIALQPDLVFVADWTEAEIVKQLRDAKIAVYAFKTPNSIDEQESLISEIAKVVGESEKGTEMITEMDNKLKYIEDKLKTLKEEDKLKAVSCDSFFYAYGKNTTFDDIATRAGMVNIISKLGMEGWTQVSKEKIVELNPDILFLPSWSYEGFDAKAFMEDIKNDKSLQNVNAIKNNRIFGLPESHMTAISQYVVLGVEDAAKAAYPELFK